MPYRPKIKKDDGTLTDLPLEAETAVRLKNQRTIGLSGVSSTAKQFNGTSSVIIPITAIPTSLLKGIIDPSLIPIAGFNLGGVKNGGNVAVGVDGTLNYNGTDARNITVLPRSGLGNYTNLEDVLNYIGNVLSNR